MKLYHYLLQANIFSDSLLFIFMMRIVLFYISLLFYLTLYAFILVLCPLAVIIFLENLTGFNGVILRR